MTARDGSVRVNSSVVVDFHVFHVFRRPRGKGRTIVGSLVVGSSIEKTSFVVLREKFHGMSLRSFFVTFIVVVAFVV